MKVDLADRTISISWKYMNEVRPVPRDRRGRALFNAIKAIKRDDPTNAIELPPEPTQIRRATTCSIFEVNDDDKETLDTLLSRASLRISHEDVFMHDAGRKISLARALRFTNLTRVERTAIWAAYFDQPRIQVEKQNLALARKATLTNATTADLHAGEA